MNKSFPITNELARSAAMKAIEQLDITKPHDVAIKPIKRNRTAAQNGLYFHWIGCIANHVGDDKHSMHEYLKGQYLMPIFVRDDDGYAALFRTVVEAMQAQGGGESVAMSALKRATSITKASQDQMREYLDDINKMCANHGIPLTVPDQWKWLGI